ncbi:hypothetical protein HOS75_gp038 [Gordonia phage SteveFrench]|uniref:DNA-binding phage zinc finger domain-containing protein n=1 Tax=Gordonia phage SteveFrench TaxID=2079281 RepID=A0A2K9VEJ1_9CAUD|nr:hypothetical protein HOS75_gp038 [Gordonia phage SteveFrench]AUV60692.1 hypothetical protein SEA_STEVEFRENCH_90 [Gordonia phage SteveFrench]
MTLHKEIKKFVMPDGTEITPLNFECEACFARAGKPCTVPTDSGRRDVNWFHLVREGKVEVVREAMSG